MYETILLPTDGSTGASQAATRAFELAREHGATVHALFVVDTDEVPQDALSGSEAMTEAFEDRADEFLETLVAGARDNDLVLTTHSTRGRPHEEILKHADELDADLIVMGYQGLSHARKEGSVARAIREATDRELLIVGGPDAVQ